MTNSHRRGPVASWHPFTGQPLTPVGYRKDGRPIFPVLGGSDTMLRKLEDQYRSRLSLVETITEEAARRDSGLSEQDRETITRAQAEAESLQKDIELLSKRLELSESVRESLRRTNPGGDHGPALFQSRGEFVLAKMRAAQGDRDALDQYQNFMRAAQHMGTTAAATTATAGGVAGLIVKPTVGPVIDVRPQGRPLAAAIGVRPSADPLSFRRPKLADPGGGMGVQALEKAELASAAYNVTADDVTLSTVGGYLNISQQLLALPIGAMDLTLDVLEQRYAKATEALVLAAMTAGADATTTLAADAGPAAFLAAIFAASARVFTATGRLAEWVAMGPTGFARVGSFVDLAERPMFPTGAAVNAMGTANAASFGLSNIAGLAPIVTPAISGEDFFVGNALAVEAYEYRFPVFDVVEPSVLGRQVSVSGAFGTYRPIAGGVARIAPGA